MRIANHRVALRSSCFSNFFLSPLIIISAPSDQSDFVGRMHHAALEPTRLKLQTSLEASHSQHVTPRRNFA